MDWKKAISAVAPTLARAVGGPIGAVALNVLSTALGVDADETALEKKVQTLTAGDLIALKNVEMEFQKSMKQLDIDFERLGIEDRANARAREIAVRDWVPSVLAIALNLAFFTLLYMVLTRAIPDPNRQAFDILLGMLGTGVVAVWSYYFGSSAGSRNKDSMIKDLHKR